jgi:hypothetical protein
MFVFGKLVVQAVDHTSIIYPPPHLSAVCLWDRGDRPRRHERRDLHGPGVEPAHVADPAGVQQASGLGWDETTANAEIQFGVGVAAPSFL